MPIDPYHHDYFVQLHHDDDSFPLPQECAKLAFNMHRSLGLSKFFDTSNLQNSNFIAQEFQKDRTHQECLIKTSDNIEITYSFFNRRSETLIIVGPGFTNCKEKMAPFAHMFLDHDVILMNFRGHGIKKNICFHPLYHIFGVDGCARLGAEEELDVMAIVQHACKQKQYKQVIGLGICFGAFVFAKAQGIAEQHHKKLFDKLILDGCWLSLNNVKQKLFNDPWLIMNPQSGGSSKITRSISKQSWFQCTLSWCMSKLFHVEDIEIDLRTYSPFITVPILFFYGKDDLLIGRNEFEEIWQTTGSQQKIALITNNPHVHNHLRSKELYSLICELFIEHSTQDTAQLLQSPDRITAYAMQKMHQKITLPTMHDVLKPIKIAKPSTIKQNIIIASLIAIPLLAYGLYRKVY